MDTFQYVFKSRYPVQIRMSDIDPLGHVNNGVQFFYYDLGRIYYFKTLQPDKMAWEGLDIVIVHTACDFSHSIYFGDNIVVETKVFELGNRSLKMIQRLIQVETNEIKSICYTVLSGFDKEKDCSKPIDEIFKQQIRTFEGLAE
jgi:acyl-CoA thioester hydrolase